MSYKLAEHEEISEAEPHLAHVSAPSAGNHDARLEELRRVIASQSFAKAPRLCSFLSYIVEKSIEGDIDSLTEQQIGIHVFNRAPGYNSNDDNIVRGTARSLRQRLSTYYLTEGAHDHLRIEVPKGAYVAEFHEGAAAPSAEAEDLAAFPAHRPALAGVPHPSPARSNWLLPAGWIVAAVLAVAAVFPYARARWTHTHAIAAPLWNTLFTHDRPTLIVPGDAGLNMFETLSKQTVDLNAYSQQSFQADPHNDNQLAATLGARFYTTMADLQLVSRFTRLPQATQSERTQVRFARDLTAADLKDTNLILMGTQSYNPWAQLFNNGPTLRMSWDVSQDLFTVTNYAPRPGEPKQYQWTVRNGVQGGLTLISLTDNTQGAGRVLLIQGTTMGGVFAAADFLQNQHLLEPILKQAQRPDGSLRNFDVLLQSDFIREGVSNLHVLSAHIR